MLRVQGVAVDVAFSRDGDRVYVLTSTGVIEVMDPHTGRLITTVAVDRNPRGLALAPNGDRLYVASQPDDEWGTGIPADPSVSVIDTSTYKRVANLALAGPSAVTVSPTGRAVFVADGDGVSVVNTATDTVTTTIALPHDDEFDAMAVSPDGATLYGVTPSTSDSNSAARSDVIALNTLTGKVQADSAATAIGYSAVGVDPNGRYVYASINSSTSGGGATPPALHFGLEVLDSKTLGVISHADAGTGVGGIAFSPDGRFAYLTDMASYKLTVVDAGTNRVVRSIPYTPAFGRAFGVPQPAAGIAVSPDGSYAYLVAFRILGSGSGTVVPLELR